jgi:uncharacterized protein YjbI with pentapeptide repeats
LDLSNFIFTNANLTNANLTSANLASANLTNANLTNANFTGTNLYGTVGFWTNEPTPLNLDNAIAKTPSGTIIGGWSFLNKNGGWILNNIYLTTN